MESLLKLLSMSYITFSQDISATVNHKTISSMANSPFFPVKVLQIAVIWNA